jgi:NAD(P)-dependent dehydrogenase (short-subunit alcohol dehydrogenase family)
MKESCEMEISLSNKTALITGASRGIGRAIALKLASVGIKVAIVGRNEVLLSELVNKIRLNGGTAEYFAFDLTKAANVTNLLEACLEKDITPNILVNNLGGVAGSKDWDSYEVIEQIFQLNFLSSYELVRQLLPHFVENNWGRVVNIGSVSTKTGMNGIPYVVGKSALEAFTKFGSRDLAQRNPNIVMTMVSPGATSVEGKYLESLERNNPKALQDWLEENNVPARRLLEVEEIANLVLFLVSDKGAFMHGSIVAIDGGSF